MALNSDSNVHNTAKFRVIYICKNEALSKKREYTLENDVTLKQFFKSAGLAINLKQPRKAYLANGNELNSLQQLRHNDCVYFSSGEPFFRSITETMHISVLGGGGVGKSAITMRFIRGMFVANWEPTIEDAYRHPVRVDEIITILDILDTAGQEDFSTMRSQWMTKKDGFIFVYSVMDLESVRQLYGFVELLEQVCDPGRLVPPIIILGNKRDLLGPSESSDAMRQLMKRDIVQLLQSCTDIIDRINQTYHDNIARQSPSLNNNNNNINNNTNDIDSSQHQCHHIPIAYEKIVHMETSALIGDTIDAVFETIVRDIRLQQALISSNNKQTVRKRAWSSWCSIL